MNRKRFLILAAILLAVLGIIIAIVCVAQCALDGGQTPLNEPIIPSAPVSPSTTPTMETIEEPSITPAPATPYMLPLVPDWEGEGPQNSPTASTIPTSTPAPTVNFVPTMGQYTSSTKDFLVIGIENEVATAIILARIEGTKLIITAIPYEALATVYTLNENCEIVEVSTQQLGNAIKLGSSERNQQAWNLIWAIKNLIGIQPCHYLCIDLACLSKVMAELDGLEGSNAVYTEENIELYLSATGEGLAYNLLDIGIGLVKQLKVLSIWELPSIQSASKGHVFSSLSTLELISLARSIQKVTSIECYYLPLTYDNGAYSLNAVEAQKILQNLYN